MKTIGRYFLPILGVILWITTVELKASSPTAHYWIDHNKLIEGTSQLIDSRLSLDLDMFKYPGAHTLYYRVQDQDGNWSSVVCVPFISNPLIRGGNAKSCEYWLDKNIDQLQQTTVSDNTVFFDLNCEDLVPGAHCLYYRIEDQFGNFGSVMSHVFYKNSEIGTHVDWYRYWWNDRYDLSTEVTVDESDTIFTLNADLSIPDYAVATSTDSHKATLNILFGDNEGYLSEVFVAEVDYNPYIMEVVEVKSETLWECHSKGNQLIFTGLTPGKGMIRVFSLDGRQLVSSVPKHENQTYTIDMENIVLICYDGVSRKVFLK